MASVPHPYPGIRPFEEADWPIFFGRDEQTNELLHRLEVNRFGAVVGSSGSGKSSLVRAGLLRLLRQGFLMDVQNWSMLVMRPGRDPFGALAAQIIRRQHGLEDNAELPPALQVSTGLLGAELQTTQGGLAEVLEQIDWPSDTHFLLVVDQFEEIFGFRSSTLGTSASRDAAERFVELMLRAASEPVPPPFASSGGAESTAPESIPAKPLPRRIWVLLTMRSDFIGNCEVFPALAHGVSSSQYLVPILTSAQKEEAIVRPGDTRYIEGAAYPAFEVERALVTRIVNDSGDRPDQLPLMQHALMRSWDIAQRRHNAPGVLRLTPADYKDSGGIARALHEHAESAWAQIKGDAHRAAIARTLFLALCDVSADGKLTRRRPNVSELETLTGAAASEIAEVLAAFQTENRNFLLPIVAPPSTHQLSSDDTLDLSHEALLRQWDTYTTWQLEERGRAAELIHLRDQAKFYKDDPKAILTPRALERAHDWQKFATPGWAVRYVTPDEWESVLEYIKASAAEIIRQQEQQLAKERAAQESEKTAQDREKRLIRRARITTAIAAGICLAIGVYAVILYINAQQAQRVARDIQVRAEGAKRDAEKATAELIRQQALRYVGLIYPDYDEGYGSNALEAMWELACLSENEEVRAKVVDTWFTDVASFNRAHGLGGEGFVAALGLSPRRRELAAGPAEKLLSGLMARYISDRSQKAGMYIDVWSDIAQYTTARDTARLTWQATLLLPMVKDLTETDGAGAVAAEVAELLQRVRPEDRTPLADGLANTMIGYLRAEFELPALSSRDPDAWFELLGVALQSTTAAVDRSVARDVAQVFADAPPETFGQRRMYRFVSETAGKLTPQEANVLGTNYAQRLDLGKVDSSEIGNVEKVWRELLPRMDAASVSTAVQILAEKYLRALESETDFSSRHVENCILLLHHLESSRGSDLSKRLNDELMSRLERFAATEPYRAARRLAREEETRSERVPPTEFERRAATFLVKEIEKLPVASRFGPTSALRSIEWLRERADKNTVKDFSNRLAADVLAQPDSLKILDYEQGFRALETLLPEMDPPIRAKIVARFLDESLSSAAQFVDESVSSKAAVLHRQRADFLAKLLPFPEVIGEQAATEATRLLAELASQERLSADDMPLLTALAGKLNERERIAILAPALTALADKLEAAKTSEEFLEQSFDSFSGLADLLPSRIAREPALRVVTAISGALQSKTDGKVNSAILLANVAFAVSYRKMCSFLGSPDAELAQLEFVRVLITGSVTITRRGDRADVAEAVMVLTSGVADHLTALRLLVLVDLIGDDRLQHPDLASGDDFFPHSDTDDVAASLRTLLTHLSTQQLAEVLKWPLCVGDSRESMLHALETRAKLRFDGDVSRVIALAPEIGLTNLEGPAFRPLPADALKEVDRLLAEKRGAGRAAPPAVRSSEPKR